VIKLPGDHKIPGKIVQLPGLLPDPATGAYSVPTNFPADAERLAALPRELQTSVGETLSGKCHPTV